MPVSPEPLTLAGADLSGIREIGTLLDFAVTMSRLSPRGKGAVPRFLGRALLSPRKNYFVTKHGGRIVIDPGNLDVFVSMRQAGNSFDYEDFRICYDLVLDGQTFYDIGANIGYFSIEMLAITRCKVAVVSFEPHTELAEAIRLSTDFSGNSNLTVFNAMVGDRSGQADFYLAPASILASAVIDSARPGPWCARVRGRWSRSTISFTPEQRRRPTW